MGKILDLSVFQEKTFDVKLIDGTLLHIGKPTQKLVIQMMQFKNIQEKSPEEQIQMGTDLVASILSFNKEEKKYSSKWVSENIDYMMQAAIMQGYQEFMLEIQSNPN